jgi:hypothetical protein
VLLQGVVPLVTAASSSSSSSWCSGSGTGLLLVLSAWGGLARLAAAAAARSGPFNAGSQLTGALQTCIQQLLPLLPLLPLAAVGLVSLQQAAAGTPAAEVVQQLTEQQATDTCWLGAADSSSSSDDGSSSDRGSSSSSGNAAGCEQVLLVWQAAVSCLRLLHPDVQLALTEPSPSPAAAAGGGGSTRDLVRAVQLRSVLVLCGDSLGWKDLTGLRNTCLRLLPATSNSSSSSSTGVAAEQALLPLAVASATAPQSGVLQQLQEVAAAARLAAAPVNAAILIAATLAAWLAAAGGSSGEPAAAAAAAAAEQQLVFGSGARGLLQQMSAVLPQLLSFDRISGSRQGFVSSVLGVLREVGTAVAERVSSGGVSGDELCACRECVEVLRAALHVVQQGGL